MKRKSKVKWVKGKAPTRREGYRSPRVTIITNPKSRLRQKIQATKEIVDHIARFNPFSLPRYAPTPIGPDLYVPASPEAMWEDMHGRHAVDFPEKPQVTTCKIGPCQYLIMDPELVGDSIQDEFGAIVITRDATWKIGKV